MDVARQLETRISPEVYLQLEAVAEEKHEYADGQMVSMAGASDDHELVASNFFVFLFNHVRGKGCRAYKSDMKLRFDLHRSSLFYYPDVMVVCDPDDRAPVYKTRPKVLAEVMSDFKKDHLEKLFVYQQIPSLEEYVVIDQDPQQPRAWLYRRENQWQQEEIASDGIISLPSLGFATPLAALYEA